MTPQPHEQQAGDISGARDDALSNVEQIQTQRQSLLRDFCRHDKQQKHVIRHYDSTRVTTFSSQLRYDQDVVHAYN